MEEANLVVNPKVIVNRTLVLECPVAGFPPPKVRWLKDGELLALREGRKLVSDGRNLEITQAALSDTARYTCVAMNEAGEVRRNFDLQVLGTCNLIIIYCTNYHN